MSYPSSPTTIEQATEIIFSRAATEPAFHAHCVDASITTILDEIGYTPTTFTSGFPSTFVEYDTNMGNSKGTLMLPELLAQTTPPTKYSLSSNVTCTGTPKGLGQGHAYWLFDHPDKEA